MARTTRSKASTGGGSSTANAATTSPASSKSRYVLPAESTNPPKLFILPRKATKEARIVSLLNPRHSKPTRYLVCPETGIYEFTKVAAPKTTPRSWLIESGTTSLVEEKTGEDSTELGTYITKGADLFIATPIDPLFLVLPALAEASKSEKRLFLSSDDHFDSLLQTSPHLSEILKHENVRWILESRMAAACETSQGNGELMFRFSEETLLKELISKAKKMADQSLPKSMEEKFVTKLLEAPVLGVKREATFSVSQDQTETTQTPELETVPSAAESSESQLSTSSSESATTTTSNTSDVSTAATSVTTTEETITTAVVASTTTEVAAAILASPEIIKLQRLRTAFQFICSSYVAPAQAAALKKMLEEEDRKSLVDFAPLDDYLAQIAKMRQDALAARSMGDYTRKRVLDDEEATERAEKKRRKEEEEKRKKTGQSRGVRDLKKVNTSGMKKMSDFFKKK